MDTSKDHFNCLEWFYGYGGLSLGVKRVEPGLRVIAACEIEAYAVANVVSKMEAGLLEPFPIWTDCKTFPCEEFHGLVDLFLAGYPCQGFSQAGKREGISDPRFLWPWVLKAAIIIRPRGILFENVEGHISLGLRTVLSDLEEAGFRTTWGIFSAAEVGAPHSRKRVFIYGELGDTTSARRTGRENPGTGGSHAKADGSWGQESERTGSELADTDNTTAPRQREQCRGLLTESEPEGLNMGRSDAWPARPGQPQHSWEAPRTTQPGLGGTANGTSHRMDRLRLCGNGVVPATAARAYSVLKERLKNR